MSPDRRAGVVPRALRSPLVWPVAALVVLLVCDAVVVPGFLSLRIQDGHLYGSLVDILKNGAPTALIALGMTLVIATRGIENIETRMVGRDVEIESLQQAFFRLLDERRLVTLPVVALDALAAAHWFD